MLSTQRPFPPLLLAPPADMPRLVNLRKRGFEERTWAGADPAWSRAHGQSPYDGSAGYLNKWEHAFVRWAEAEGLALRLPHRLRPGGRSRRRWTAMASSSWSATANTGPARSASAIDGFVDAGGRLAIFSGNTAFWKVRWEDGGRTMICHKWKGFEADPSPRPTPTAGTHLWSHPAFGRPEAETTGLSFIFGGYHRLGLCAARGQGGYTVYRDRSTGRWRAATSTTATCSAMRSRCRLRERRLPVRLRRRRPARADRRAWACRKTWRSSPSRPAAFAETPSPYRPLIPPEQLDVVAEIAYGSTPARRPRRGCCAATR